MFLNPTSAAVMSAAIAAAQTMCWWLCMVLALCLLLQQFCIDAMYYRAALQ
jgi:hypothetical protein